MAVSKQERLKIIKDGMEISGGYGFWGHEIRSDPEQRDNAENAFIDGLKEKGYSGKLIACFGDFNVARHIADDMWGAKSYKKMKERVKRAAMKKEEVTEICIQDYPDFFR